MSNSRISIFDILKVGIGPSSSHTMGPWRAAARFVDELPEHLLTSVTRLRVDLYGSLAKTGRGHGTDIAVQLGLCGEDPTVIEPDVVHQRIADIAEKQKIDVPRIGAVEFSPDKDITFHTATTLPFHPNAMRVSAVCANGTQCEETYYSVGGGFIVTETDAQTGQPANEKTLPFPVDNAAQLLAHCGEQVCGISEIVRKNELAWRSADDVRQQLRVLRDTMFDSIVRGCNADGILPGGLKVQRRARQTAQELLGTKILPDNHSDWLTAVKQQSGKFQTVLDWVSCFALAVNEENAAFGRVVTAPTNGAAGVIPAVLMYYECFCDAPADGFERFLLTAAEIGCIFKKGATISAAMGGCQAEIGVSSAMAAAALAECLGGSAAHATEAAEIAMEHHLGMTCDPVGGLVQIPCIERNAMGAIKAISAAQLALKRDPSNARVTLDEVIQTMWQTAQDMNSKYKETSEGGLAIQIAVNVAEC